MLYLLYPHGVDKINTVLLFSSLLMKCSATSAAGDCAKMRHARKTRQKARRTLLWFRWICPPNTLKSLYGPPAALWDYSTGFSSSAVTSITSEIVVCSSICGVPADSRYLCVSSSALFVPCSTRAVTTVSFWSWNPS